MPVHLVDCFVRGAWQYDQPLYSLAGYHGLPEREALKTRCFAMINGPNLIHFPSNLWWGEFWFENLGGVGASIGKKSFFDALTIAESMVQSGEHKISIWLVGGQSNMKIAEINGGKTIIANVFSITNAYINSKANFRGNS